MVLKKVDDLFMLLDVVWIFDMDMLSWFGSFFGF